TAGIVFAGASGTADTWFRLAPADRAIALAAGAQAAPELGPDWVRLPLFRPNWPKLDLVHWARKAYAHARGQAG
ncbi:MAG TPA: hypothetical protein VHE37_12475, partial [Nevskiaceae bacterium]|nr:hypothetical protein [Nevskiaceae bacterium]